MSYNYRVAIVIVAYNNVHDTIECLASYYQTAYNPQDFIVLIDNASVDDTSERVRSKYPEILSIRSESNLGYAGGNNLGILNALACRPKYLLIINNDVIFVEDVISPLVVVHESDTTLGAISPLIYVHDKPELEWYSGVRWDPRQAKFITHKSGAKDAILHATDYASGCAMMLRSEVINSSLLFDDGLFLTWEEPDLCYRLKMQGRESKVVTNCKINHKVSRSFEGGYKGEQYNYYYSRNRILFIKRHWRQLSVWRVAVRLVREIWWDAVAVLRNDHTSNIAAVRVKGLIDGLAGRKGMKALRTASIS